MARRAKRPASRGSVNNLILKALSAGDKYGYEIIKEVEVESDGKIVLKQPSLYSSLTRFETKGFVTSYWEDSEIGGRRHYYSLTPAGKDYYTKFVLKEELDDDSIESNEVQVAEEEITQAEEYLIDDNVEDEKIEQSFSKYTFNVQDKINELLNDTEESEEEESSFDDNITEADSIEAITDENEDFETEDNDIYETEAISIEEDSKNIIEEPIETKPEVKSAREQLKEIYNSIVTGNKPIRKPKEELSIKRPLTAEELQKKKESMQILYGHSQETNKQEEKPPTTENKRERLFQSSDYQELVKTSNEIAKQNSQKVKADPVVQPKKRFVVDEFGIMKIAEDFPEKQQPKVFDNVGYRTTNSGHNVTEYKPTTPYLPKPNQPQPITTKEKQASKPPVEIELTEEERALRQERFNERFANLQKEKAEQRGIVQETSIITNYTAEANDGRPPATFTNKNVKLFRDLPENEVEDDNDVSFINEASYENKIDNSVELEEQSFKPEIMNNDNSILELQKELINKGVEFKSYSKENTIRTEHDFVLHNKLKRALGFILLFLMAIETTVFLFVAKNMGFYLADNNILFIGAYSIIGIVCLCLILPGFIAPNKRKLNNFRFGYNFLFGLFAFILTGILSYALNTLAGLTLENISYYLTSLILPMVLAINFIIIPFIYNLLLKTKSFY